jgi:hypothetical protein
MTIKRCVWLTNVPISCSAWDQAGIGGPVPCFVPAGRFCVDDRVFVFVLYSFAQKRWLFRLYWQREVRFHMARREQIEALMVELGSLADPWSIEAFGDRKAWGIRFDEERAVLIDFDEEEGKLIISRDIGTPMSTDRTRLYEAMLRHNFHWDLTGGTRLAVDGPGGSVVMIADLVAEGLDARQLNAALSGFNQSADAWKAIVAGEPAKAAGSEQAGSGLTMIRV